MATQFGQESDDDYSDIYGDHDENELECPQEIVSAIHNEEMETFVKEYVSQREGDQGCSIQVVETPETKLRDKVSANIKAKCATVGEYDEKNVMSCVKTIAANYILGSEEREVYKRDKNEIGGMTQRQKFTRKTATDRVNEEEKRIKCMTYDLIAWPDLRNMIKIYFEAYTNDATTDGARKYIESLDKQQISEVN